MFVVIVNDTDGSTCQAVIDRVKGQLTDITDVGKYSDLPTIQKVRYLTCLYNMGGLSLGIRNHSFDYYEVIKYGRV